MGSVYMYNTKKITKTIYTVVQRDRTLKSRRRRRNGAGLLSQRCRDKEKKQLLVVYR
jgi:hypothetical protein